MLKKISILAAMALLIQACPKEISRLDESTQKTNIDKLLSSDEFLGARCDDASNLLFKARDESKHETERLKTYVDLYLSLLDRKNRLEEIIARNSDLAYQEGSQAILDSQETCSRLVTDVRIETERFTRDLAETPTVQEIKGNSTVIVTRVDFSILRRAIEAIDLDGKQELLRNLDNAEQKLGPTKPTSRRGR
ncbi:MAG: hypothetical protein FWG75_04075 [Cystobacterineae bacterium]|nr:hypothetical protein [Cystobacterineae bacterium]